MEGIYIRETAGGLLYGFVISFHGGAYVCGSFTACTLEFVIDHAQAKGLSGQQLAPVYCCASEVTR